jgi:hypothetical protein
MSPETPKDQPKIAMGQGLSEPGKQPEVSMKDFQDLMGQKFESNHLEKFA